MITYFHVRFHRSAPTPELATTITPMKWRRWESTWTCWRRGPRTWSRPTDTASPPRATDPPPSTPRYLVSTYLQFFAIVWCSLLPLPRLPTSWRSCRRSTAETSTRWRGSWTSSARWSGSPTRMPWVCIYSTKVCCDWECVWIYPSVNIVYYCMIFNHSLYHLYLLKLKLYYHKI